MNTADKPAPPRPGAGGCFHPGWVNLDHLSEPAVEIDGLSATEKHRGSRELEYLGWLGKSTSRTDWTGLGVKSEVNE